MLKRGDCCVIDEIRIEINFDCSLKSSLITSKKSKLSKSMLIKRVYILPFLISNNYLFSFEIILHAKKQNLKIGEVPVTCDYKSEHTSHKLFGRNSAFSYQLETFKLIYNYFRKCLVIVHFK